MEKGFSTGNRTADRLAQLCITGNVIPQVWYKTIRRATGKPNLNAIVILADIVYWYRPAEVREEGSGMLVGYRKRFKGDLLQRSYQQIADQFGITKRDATNAVVELEKLGVVKRVFKTLETEGISVPNVLFLDLDADALERLTYPPEEGGKSGTCEEGDGSMRAENGKKSGIHEEMQDEEDISDVLENGDISHHNGEHVSPEPGRGVTRMRETPPRKTGRPLTQMGEDTENTYRDYNRESFSFSYQQMLAKFKEQIGYGQLQEEYFCDRRLDELVAVAVEVLTSPADTIRVNREERPARLVKAQFAKLEGEHVEYVLEQLDQTGKPIKNVRAVLVTALYNAVNTLGCHVGNLYRCHMQQETTGG